MHSDPLPPSSPPISDSSDLDTTGVRKSILALPDQCQQVFKDMATTTIPPHCYNVNNIVVSGMGGSVLGGRIIASLERQIIKIPVIISTEYHLPNFVNERTLVIICSYSGNTEETLSSLAEARARGAQIFIIASGGKLAELARQFDFPNYIFHPLHNPSNQPRMGLGYNIMSLVVLLSRCQLLHQPSDLGLLPQFLRSRQSNFPHLVHLSRDLTGHAIAIICAEHLKGAAYAMRNQLHENAKTFAVMFDLPELNHHLLEGLTYPQNLKDHLTFLFIDSPRYHPEVTRRFALTQEIVKKQRLSAYHLEVAGNSQLFEAMDLVQSGAYLAYSLSQINGVDPGPIPWVDWFKDKMHDQT
ncbi:hypothetical protein A2634_04180 [Candidatus Amesbacteria bacterium RIFCSPHIGHO2_01_FULL_48_32]|uniref:SIS domain-containing protein n=1 Tax=Candidatus Amesbacteria bacterium RIFCSPLOWO2_01_FULL_48_25 TaxID=1797259 RepID=A0A1F4ZBZ5_9BACT|nr:MAG: hypothetical protein A2634_04180 [Candidatus Amesbacteria bacterium RIFCSPHIGHO2_01_FULL_48_32]OGD03899.1 MAG: hypothetical protein A2989_04330 [Candidatus Amesbacteria bacterium RIFCSPLOWO2_01_FULL_48_25]HJZ05876.1 SIS domain-containing protein [Patescibacteria group bacterium]